MRRILNSLFYVLWLTFRALKHRNFKLLKETGLMNGVQKNRYSLYMMGYQFFIRNKYNSIMEQHYQEIYDPNMMQFLFPKTSEDFIKIQDTSFNVSEKSTYIKNVKGMKLEKYEAN